MKEILYKCQSNLSGSWVGSMVVHMGDHNVPNALMFIDKVLTLPWPWALRMRGLTMMIGSDELPCPAVQPGAQDPEPCGAHAGLAA